MYAYMAAKSWTFGQTVDVLPPIACHRGTVAVSFGLRRMLNSMVNARDSRFILVQALDRRSSNNPTGRRVITRSTIEGLN